MSSRCATPALVVAALHSSTYSIVSGRDLMDKLHWKSAADIAHLIRGKKLSASEVLEHFLARVDRFNSKLNAIVWQDRERARKRANAADAALAKGEIWGPLHGVPMTIKESYNVAGSPTTWGNPALKANVTDAS